MLDSIVFSCTFIQLLACGLALAVLFALNLWLARDKINAR